MMQNEAKKEGIMDLIAFDDAIDSGAFEPQQMVDRYSTVYMGMDDDENDENTT